MTLILPLSVSSASSLGDRGATHDVGDAIAGAKGRGLRSAMRVMRRARNGLCRKFGSGKGFVGGG